MSEPSEIDEFLLMLSEENIITNFSINDDGTVGRYNIDWELFRAKYPEVAEVFWESHCKEVDAALSELVDEGLIEAFPVIEDGNVVDVAYRLPDDNAT